MLSIVIRMSNEYVGLNGKQTLATGSQSNRNNAYVSMTIARYRFICLTERKKSIYIIVTFNLISSV